MKHLLALLATTQNHNRGDLRASKRIAEIYQYLKNNPLSEEADKLVLEALKLKKTPQREIEELYGRTSSNIRLFCFPYAGGNKRLYENWQEYLPASIRIHPIEYPGRGTKIKEKLALNLEQILAHLEREILDAPKSRFAFFGHSLGAIIAFELALILRDKYGMIPDALFLSGSPSPDTVTRLSSISAQDDQSFLETLQKLNGIPPSLLKAQEFKEFYMPILRSDFSLMNGYGRKVEKVSFPLVLFGSNRDPIVLLSEMKKWTEWSEQKIELHEVEGDHFFVHDPKQILQHIVAKLCPL